MEVPEVPLSDLIKELALMFPSFEGQDNRATAHPVYLVKQKRRIHGMDPDYGEEYDWVDMGSGDYEVTSRGDEEYDLLEQMDSWAWQGEHPEGWEKTYYMDIDVYVQAFFTLEGAERYIKANAHNLKEPLVYVDSAYRNFEWIAIRQFIYAVLKEHKDDRPTTTRLHGSSADWQAELDG